jgi:hypothetical protein
MATISSLAFGLAVLAVFYRFFLYPAVLSPLAKIPLAHWSCAISPLWILLARKNREENRILHAVHHKHGPVVRVAPNALSVDGVEGLRTIYQGGFEKWKWYSEFNNYGLVNNSAHYI